MWRTCAITSTSSPSSARLHTRASRSSRSTTGRRTTHPSIVLQCVRIIPPVRAIALALNCSFTVLHPCYKQKYFAHAHWPHAWVEESLHLLPTEWEQCYRNATEPEVEDDTLAAGAARDATARALDKQSMGSQGNVVSHNLICIANFELIDCPGTHSPKHACIAHGR